MEDIITSGNFNFTRRAGDVVPGFVRDPSAVHIS